MCYYFDEIINGTKINFSIVLLNEKLHENISVYTISNKTPAGPKPLRIRFDKIYGFAISLDCKIKHLALIDYGILDKICDKIKYLIGKKSVVTNSINYNFQKITIDSYNSSPVKKISTFHNVTIFVKSIANKNEINSTIICF